MSLISSGLSLVVGKSKSRTTELLALIALGGVLAACGSTSASSATATTAASQTAAIAGVVQAQKIVDQAMAPPSWNGPTASVDTTHLKGKSVWFVSLTEEAPALHEWAGVAEAQLKKAGVSVQICDAKASPAGMSLCMQQAIAAKPTALVTVALDVAFIKKYIAQANSAGIKVITAQDGVPEIPQGTGAVAEVSFDYAQVGKVLGAWFAESSKCVGYPQIITSTSSPQPAAAEVGGITKEISALCPSSKPIPVVNSLITNWTTTLAPTVRSILTANPNISYMLPIYDDMTTFMNPAIQQLNLSRKIRVASFNATPVVMQNELAIKSSLSADVGGPNEWYGLALADQTFRVLAGAPVVANENIPLRLFTRKNIGSINIKANESTWYGSVNYACDYQKLWGMSCS